MELVLTGNAGRNRLPELAGNNRQDFCAAGGTSTACAQSLSSALPPPLGQTSAVTCTPGNWRVGALKEHQDLLLLPLPCWKLGRVMHTQQEIPQLRVPRHHSTVIKPLWSLWATVTPQLWGVPCSRTAGSTAPLG